MLYLLLYYLHPFNLNVLGGCHLCDFLGILLWDVSYFSMRQSQRCFNVEQFLNSGFFVKAFEHFWRSIAASVDWQDRQVSLTSRIGLCRLNINVVPIH